MSVNMVKSTISVSSSSCLVFSIDGAHCWRIKDSTHASADGASTNATPSSTAGLPVFLSNAVVPLTLFTSPRGNIFCRAFFNSDSRLSRTIGSSLGGKNL